MKIESNPTHIGGGSSSVAKDDYEPLNEVTLP